MSANQPAAETERERITRQVADAHVTLTDMAAGLPPAQATALLLVRDAITDLAAYYAGIDRRLDQEEELTRVFLSGDAGLLGPYLCSRLTAPQREDLARQLTEEPWP